MNAHRKLLEATNAGHYFAECTCGWSGGVHRDRATAGRAHAAHVAGSERVVPVRPIILFGPRARGMTAEDSTDEDRRDDA